MRPKPYIGVTGVTSRAQADALMSVVPKECDLLIMLGYLVSDKTLRGESNKWPKRYPNVGTLREIIPDHKNALNLIHINTKSQQNLHYEMLHAQELAGPYCCGFQLNVAWPDKRELEAYKNCTIFARNCVVLQCGNRALDELHRDPRKIAARVREYEGLIDHVLIDPSGGLGKEFNGEFADKCFDELAKAVPDVGLVIAGGLHKRNVVSKLSPLLDRHVLSWDAEGKLRTPDDDLDITEAQDYVRASVSLSRFIRFLNEQGRFM